MEIQTKINESSVNTERSRVELRFICPVCGGRKLRETLLEVSYPIRSIEKIEVNPDDLEEVEVFDSGEEEYYHSGHVDGWRYTCAQCGQELTYEEEGQEHYVEDKVTSCSMAHEELSPGKSRN